MTDLEAQQRAARLGLVALADPRGWRLLLSGPGGAMAARGGSWGEAFANLEEIARRAPVCSECGGSGCLWCPGR